MKKIVLWALWLWFLFSFSYGAVLSLSPSEWAIPQNCLQSFDIHLRMDEWDEVIASDLIMMSNMKFVKFENANMFKYYVPDEWTWNTRYLLLFNEPWWEITQWWLVWTLYYDTMQVQDPYIEFLFLWEWDTTDTNLSIHWRDVLKAANPGKYTISQDLICENPVILPNDTYNFDEFMQNFESDHKSERFLHFLQTNKRYVLWIVWLLIIIIVLVSYKAQKKW